MSITQDNGTRPPFLELSEWKWEHLLLFWAGHLIAVEILQHAIVMNVGKVQPRKIEVRGRHLEELTTKDKTFIVFNRLTVPFLTYFLVRFCWTHPEHVEWNMDKITPLNTLGSLTLFFLAYDFVYTLFHRAIHIRAFYPFVHKVS